MYYYLISYLLLPLLLLAPSSSKAESLLSCDGPRTPGELRQVLWGEGSGYDPRTRPGVAKAAANTTLMVEYDMVPFQAPPDEANVQIHIYPAPFSAMALCCN